MRQWPDVKLKALLPQALLRRSCELGMLGRCEMAANGKAAARGTARSAAPQSLLKKDDSGARGGSFEEVSDGSGGGGRSEASSGTGSGGGSGGFNSVSDGGNGDGGSDGTSMLKRTSGEFGGSVAGDEETWEDDSSDGSVGAMMGASEANGGGAGAQMARPQDLLVGEAATTQQLHAGGRNPASLADEGGSSKDGHTTGGA